MASYIEYFNQSTIDTTILTAEQEQVFELINQKVAGLQNLQEMLQLIFEKIQHVLPIHRIGIAFVEPNRQRITSHTSLADYDTLYIKDGFSQDLDTSSLKEVIQSNSIRIIYDLDQYLKHHSQSPSTKLLTKEGIKSNLTCPLQVDKRTVGVLFLSSREVRGFSREHVALQLAIRERVSQAIEKVYRIELLEEANRSYFEMLGFVSHELKSPLASVVTDANLLLDGYLGELPKPHADTIKRIVKHSDYLLDLIKDYMNLARLEGSKLQLNKAEPFNIVEKVISPAVEIIRSQMLSQEVQYVEKIPDKEIFIEGDSTLLVIVMVNLLSNAVKYGEFKGMVELVCRECEETIEISVYNEGPGFPKEQQNQLFKKFSRLNTPELKKRKGSGVGLYTTWRIIKLHGGSIWAESEEGNWAKFTCHLPKKQS